MKNISVRPSNELIYSFPLDSPMATIHCDLYQPGKTVGFDGDTAEMIVCCNMTTFTATESVKDLSSTGFAKAVYTIMLRFGLANLIITDPDSKFHGIFVEMCSILKIKHHFSAKGNHNAIIVERFNKFLNSSLRIFCNSRGTIRSFREGILLTVYAWNSAPVVGTDLSRSLLTVGREFHFPIDFANNSHISYTVDTNNIKNFAHDLTSLLYKCREVYKTLISEHRAMHREYRNAQLANPTKFNLGDYVFTNVQVQSKQSTGTVKN